MMKKLTLILSTLALITGLSSVRAETIEHNLLPGKPFEGTTINILSVVTPQFDGLMLRDDEFTGGL